MLCGLAGVVLQVEDYFCAYCMPFDQLSGEKQTTGALKSGKKEKSLIPKQEKTCANKNPKLEEPLKKKKKVFRFWGAWSNMLSRNEHESFSRPLYKPKMIENEQSVEFHALTVKADMVEDIFHLTTAMENCYFDGEDEKEETTVCTDAIVSVPRLEDDILTVVVGLSKSLQSRKT